MTFSLTEVIDLGTFLLILLTFIFTWNHNNQNKRK